MALDRILTDGSETGLSVANKINLSFDSIDENDLNRHNHSNLAILNNIIDTGSGDNYLSDDGTYKVINTTTNWGDIQGTLSNQTDLNDALDLKANLTGAVFTGDVDVIERLAVGSYTDNINSIYIRTGTTFGELAFTLDNGTKAWSLLCDSTEDLMLTSSYNDNFNIDTNGSVTIKNNQIWHAGNLDPNDYLTAVFDDKTPKLGGNLDINGYSMLMSDGTILRGVIGMNSEGAYFAYSDNGLYNDSNGAFYVTNGGAGAKGTKFRVDSLKATEYRQVYVSKEGDLFGVTPPDPGWKESISSTDTVDLNESQGTWYQIPNLKINTPQDLSTGDTINAISTVYIQNYAARDDGTVEFGVGIDGAMPTTAFGNTYISEGFVGPVSVALHDNLTNSYAANTEFKLFIRIDNINSPGFDPWVNGSLGTHHFEVGTPTAGGGEVTEWGSITGTLSNQTDLNDALDAKADLSGAEFTGGVKINGSSKPLELYSNDSNTIRLPFGDYTDTIRGEIQYIHGPDFFAFNNVNGSSIELYDDDSIVANCKEFKISARDLIFEPSPTNDPMFTFKGYLNTQGFNFQDDNSNHLLGLLYIPAANIFNFSFNTGGDVQVNGNNVFHEGNFDPSLKVTSDPSGIVGASSPSNMVVISQADYDNLTPDANTLYFIK